MSTSKTPASRVISKLGGPERVAALAGVHLSRVYRWMAPRSSGGTGGSIPQRHVVPLLIAAQVRGIDLKADDFLSDTAVLPRSGATVLKPPEASHDR